MKGGVDLGTLSELTKSVGVTDGGMENVRSKRTCVRVREEISKLQDILNDDLMDTKPARAGARGKGRGVSGGGGGRVSIGANQSVEFVSDGAVSDGESGVLQPSKKKRSSYSQFTHKRRKRKRKTIEEGKVVSVVMVPYNLYSSSSSSRSSNSNSNSSGSNSNISIEVVVVVEAAIVIAIVVVAIAILV